jgi:hypothetical protein
MVDEFVNMPHIAWNDRILEILVVFDNGVIREMDIPSLMEILLVSEIVFVVVFARKPEVA